MRETILYMRGVLPFGGRPEIPDGLVRDARILLTLEPAALKSIRDELQRYPGFLDRGTVEDILRSSVKEEEACRALTRLVTGIDNYLRNTKQSAKDLLSQIERWLADDANRAKGLLSPEEFAVLQDRLPLIAGPYPGRVRQAKAERLSEATGLPLEQIEIICDLRPVFDKDRQTVEGMIPYTTLKVVCKGVDGLPVALGALLSHDDVVQLAEATADAKKKLAGLRQLMQQKELPIPCVDMTMEGDDK